MARLYMFAPLVILLLALAMSSSAIEIVRDGEARASIFIGSSPSAQAKEAATELQTYIRRITGAELPIAGAPSDAPSAAILVGQDAGKAFAAEVGVEIPSGLTSSFDEEGYVIAAQNNVLLLAGNETEPYQGTYYAVSDFLQSLGCRWYMPGEFGEIVPTLADIVVKPQRREVKPEFRVRDLWYSGHLKSTPEQIDDFSTWRRRNGYNRRDLWFNCTLEGSRFLQNPVDDSTWRLLPKDIYWDSHPEYYALNSNGSRNDRFICATNSDAIQAAVDTIINYFKDNPHNYSFAFSPPDAPVLCHCPDCKKAMNSGFGGEGHGDVSDTYFRLVFTIADKVRAVYPDRWIISMAYYNRCRPPQGVEGKHPNVLIQLASIQQCSLHSYEDKQCWSRQHFLAMMKRWSELTGSVVLYEYDPLDWTHIQRPMWRSKGTAHDLRQAKRLGGWGFSDEGQMAWLSTGLNYYIRGRLAWDLSQDPLEMEQEFFNNFFGPAAAPMGKYYRAIQEAMEGADSHLTWLFEPQHVADDVVHILNRPVLDQCASYLYDAQRLASAEEPFAGRVSAFLGHFARLDACQKSRAAMTIGDYKQAAEWGDAMLQVVEIVDNTLLLQDAGPWGGISSGAAIAEFARSTLQWTDGTKGRLLAVLPSTASFRTDPGSDGLVYEWYRTDEETADWRPIKMTTSWHNQGIVTSEGRPYTGVEWYHIELNMMNIPDSPIQMFIPELKSPEAWVWCNGQFAGHIKKAPAGLVVDLSDLLNTGKNDIVFRARGAGGISLPPFLFEPVQ